MSFSKQWNKDRHLQTMHQNYKYTCDVCFSQFTRMYALNNHKKSGKCKLDLFNNPIVQVTPLGMLPSTSDTEKVSQWLHPSQATKKQRTETVCDRPSTSKTMDQRPSTSATPICIKGARKQIASQASTALPPKDSQWQPRTPFSLHLPSGHQDQKTLGNLPESTTPVRRNPSPLSLPLPAFALRSPTPTYDSDNEGEALGGASHYTGSTRPAGTPTSSPSNDSLDQMAAEVMRGLGASSSPNQGMQSTPPQVSFHRLNQDLALSEDDLSSDLPDPSLNHP